MADTKIKMKNTEAEGKSLRVQSWSGKLPTYDNEKQRGAAMKAQAVGVDANGNPDNVDNKELQVGTSAGSPSPNEEAQAQANAAAAGNLIPENFDKLKKAELIDLLEERKAAGFDISHDEETDTVAVLREKISNTYAQEKAGKNTTANKTGVAPAEPDTAANAGAAVNFSFSRGQLLSEVTLTPGEEKVITISAGMFITIKEDI